MRGYQGPAEDGGWKIGRGGKDDQRSDVVSLSTLTNHAVPSTHVESGE